MPPLNGTLVVDFTWYLPGPFASRELLRLGARVVHVEPPGGDPMRPTAPAWHDAVNAGKESVVCDLKTEEGLALANGLCARADVVLDGFRPGVLDRLGIVVPDTAVLCAVTGFGAGTGTSSAPDTTSTTSAGQACSPTPLRRCRRRRSPTSPPAASPPRWR